MASIIYIFICIVCVCGRGRDGEMKMGMIYREGERGGGRERVTGVLTGKEGDS